MEIEILAIACFVTMAIIFFLLGTKELLKKDINIDQFVPGYDGYMVITDKPKKKKEHQAPLNKSIMLILVGVITIGTAAYAVIGIVWISFCASLLGFVVPYIWLKWHEASQEKIIASQLEQAVEIMSSVIRSGGGIVSALRRSAQVVGAPLNSELTKVASEIELGVSTANAFKNLAERVPMQETKMMAMVMEIQQSGMAVNLASVFDQIQINIRNKQALQEEVRAITVENKMAGWIVAAVPFVTISLIRWSSPDFIAPLFTTTAGLFVFLLSTGLIIGGVFWIMKMAEMPDL
jgi:tight adherence protein B